MFKKRKNYQNEYLLGQIDDFMGTVGCPICALTEKAVHDYIDALFYENVNDPVERRNFVQGHAYCSKHLKMIEEHLETHPDLGILGVNILYHDIFDYLLNGFEEEIRIGDGCELCRVEESAQRRYVELFSEYFSFSQRREKYASSISMVCLRHTYMLKKVKNFDFELFSRIQKEKLESLRKHVEEFVRKSDYRYAKEGITREEGLAWKILSKFLE